MLNLWIDYLICNGWLQGPVFNTDPDNAERPFTIPFGLEGERLKGGFMLLLKGKDPFPIFPSLQLTKQRPAQELEATQFDRKGDSPKGRKWIARDVSPWEDRPRFHHSSRGAAAETSAAPAGLPIGRNVDVFRSRKMNDMKIRMMCIGWLLRTVWTGCTAGDVPWTPSETLVGTWEGKSEFYVPFFEKGASQGEHSDEPVAIRIHIASDGSVDGQVGTARLVGCKIKHNRGWFGRMLNLWSDYVISDGWLEGPVFSADQETKRPFDFSV